MNTETLRTFIAAAQIKNFTKTAEHLFIAQSTVTNRILDLESEIGKPLFTRKHKQIELTEAGLQFLDYAKQLVDLETTALQTVRSSLSSDERLRIGTTNTIYECRLQHALRKWMKAKPLSTIILNIGHTTEMIESLKKGNLDMVFSFVSFYGDGYWCRPYYSEDLCLVCTAEDTTWADGISKENLPEIDYLFSNFALQGLGLYIRDLFPKHHRFRLEIDNSTKLPAYIREGLGYTFLPAGLLQDPAVSTGIRIIPLLDFAPPKIDSYCIMRRDRPLPIDWEDFFLCDKA
ncbi:MAG: LysR family transcriptional regulator [Megasphaera micronuciformis]|nr:LysR family transcriptional regulator [Megasphaera micronuciformis]